MFKRGKSEPGLDRPANPESLLAQTVNRYAHLCIDFAVCVGILVLVVCLVVATRALDDWFQLGM